jgi:CelD/BcsL family acetyltransferase involved in cellulose biosynthesis
VAEALVTAADGPPARLVDLDPDDPRWLAFLSGRPEATPFHHPAWTRCLAEAYGWSPSVAALVVGDRVRAGLPTLHLPGRPGRRIALPFTDHCAPLADSEPSLAGLLDGLARRHGPSAPLVVHAPLPTPSARCWQDSVLHLLELEPTPAAIRAGLRPPVRRMLAQAERAGVEVRLGRSLEDVRVYYRLHCLTRRRQGVPVQRWRYFASLWSHVIEAGLGTVAIATWSQRPVAGAIFLAWNRRLVYKYGASDPHHWRLRPNHLVMYRAIEWGVERGCRELDLGKSDLEGRSLREYKSRWGARELPLMYSALGAAPARRPRWVMAAMGLAIRHSPLALTRALALLYPKAA